MAFKKGDLESVSHRMLHRGF